MVVKMKFNLILRLQNRSLFPSTLYCIYAKMELLTKTHNVEQLEFIEDTIQEYFLGQIKLVDVEKRFQTDSKYYSEICLNKELYEKLEDEVKESVYAEQMLNGLIWKMVVDISFYIRYAHNLLPKKWE